VVVALEKSRQSWTAGSKYSPDYSAAGLLGYSHRRTSGASGSDVDEVAPFTLDGLKRTKNEKGKND
jgi:hypothetical protein